MQYNLMGGSVRKVMKKEVVPHKFLCQEDRIRAASPQPSKR